MHVGIAYLRWLGKRSRHSRRMRTRDLAYLARGPCRQLLWQLLLAYVIILFTATQYRTQCGAGKCRISRFEINIRVNGMTQKRFLYCYPLWGNLSASRVVSYHKGLVTRTVDFSLPLSWPNSWRGSRSCDVIGIYMRFNQSSYNKTSLHYSKTAQRQASTCID